MKRREWHHLDELFAGSCDGMTYEEIEETFPEEFRRRKVDKLAYRYPRFVHMPCLCVVWSCITLTGAYLGVRATWM